MAQRVEIQFTDDIDGGPADVTVNFAVDGTAYEIDLSSTHADEFRAAMEPFTANARRPDRVARRASRVAAAGKPSPSVVREWARSEGIKVSDRGRVPAELVVKFQEAGV